MLAIASASGSGNEEVFGWMKTMGMRASGRKGEDHPTLKTPRSGVLHV
jgi:hypothetical protein